MKLGKSVLKSMSNSISTVDVRGLCVEVAGCVVAAAEGDGGDPVGGLVSGEPVGDAVGTFASSVGEMDGDEVGTFKGTLSAPLIHHRRSAHA